MLPRYFGFDGDNIYAINVTVEEKKKQVIYTKEIVRSDDRGKSWEKVDENTDTFVLTDQGMQEKLTELKSWEAEEIQEKISLRDATEKSKKDLAAKQEEARKAWRKANAKWNGEDHPTTGTPKSTAGHAPDYRAQANDRFKEMHNHRDSWIDSKGSAHIH